jgi:hypothetical protein
MDMDGFWDGCWDDGLSRSYSTPLRNHGGYGAFRPFRILKIPQMKIVGCPDIVPIVSNL